MFPTAIALALLVVASDSATPSGTGAGRDAAEIVDALSAGRYAEVEARFDPAMRSALPPGKLAQLWAGLRAQLGELVRRDGPVVTRSEPHLIADVPASFERGDVRIRVAFDGERRIAGLRVLPPEQRAVTPVAPPADMPSQARAGPYVEREVTIGSGEWRLPGTLTLPSGKAPVPAVVLVHGSGPHDRDETVGGVKPFRDLALGLASRGVAVLRYEKRTKVYGERLASRPELVTLEAEIVDDAVAAVGLLARMPEIDAKRIVVAGHSLGAMVLPRIAARTPKVRALAGLATATRPLDELARAQLEYLRALQGGGPAIGDEMMAELATLRREPPPRADARVLGAPVSWWKQVMAVDPTAEYARVKLPLLFLQGGRDYQVPPEELDRLERALQGRTGVTYRRYPRLNHLFVAGEGRSTPAEYAVPGHVAPEVVDDLAAFVLGLR